MLRVLFASLAAGSQTWSLGDVLIGVIVVAALVAIVWVAVRAMGIVVPQYIVHVLWIIAVAVIAILAIRFLLSI